MSSFLYRNVFKRGSQANNSASQCQMCVRFYGTKTKPEKKETRPTATLRLPQNPGASRTRPILINEDGIYKHSGQYIGTNMSRDGKPVYPGRHKWYRSHTGQKVTIGNVVCYQKRLNFHPGLNVGIGRDLTLYTFENGIVYITWEKASLNWDHKYIQDYYFDQKDMNIYKPYYNVITKEQPKFFRLLEQF